MCPEACGLGGGREGRGGDRLGQPGLDGGCWKQPSSKPRSTGNSRLSCFQRERSSPTLDETKEAPARSERQEGPGSRVTRSTGWSGALCGGRALPSRADGAWLTLGASSCPGCVICGKASPRHRDSRGLSSPPAPDPPSGSVPAGAQPGPRNGPSESAPSPAPHTGSSRHNFPLLSREGKRSDGWKTSVSCRHL